MMDLQGGITPAVSYNGSTLESSLYKKLDGTLDEQSASANVSNVYEGQIVFGEQANTLTDGDDLDGILDEIRFWTVAKDSFQIARNRNRSLQKSDTGGERVDDLLAYWKMDEGLGTSAYDMADIDEGEAYGKEVYDLMEMLRGLLHIQKLNFQPIQRNG